MNFAPKLSTRQRSCEQCGHHYLATLPECPECGAKNPEDPNTPLPLWLQFAFGLGAIAVFIIPTVYGELWPEGAGPPPSRLLGVLLLALLLWLWYRTTTPGRRRMRH